MGGHNLSLSTGRRESSIEIGEHVSTVLTAGNTVFYEK